MKRLLTLLMITCATKLMVAQNVGIGTTTPNANAALEIKSNNKGLLMPRLSTTARNSMTNVAKGMLVYDTTNAGFYYHDGGKWFPISQSNTDSLLLDTYPGYPATIATMPIAGTGLASISSLYGTIYDDGGPNGDYSSHINNAGYVITRSSFSEFIKVEIEEMNLESPNDSLVIYSDSYNDKKEVFTGNRTGIFYFRGNRDVVFNFNSNGKDNLSGFKINWTRISTNSQTVEQPPLTGFYFNSQQLAARIGVNINDKWATNNLGKYSFAAGYDLVANGYGATALGMYNFAMGENSTAIGSGNTASGISSIALGTGNIVSGNAATANGFYLIAKSDYSTVIGKLNDTSQTGRIFEIGNGISYNTRSNAVTVLANGNTGIGNTTPVTQLDVEGGIRTKYSGSVIKSVTGTGSAELVNLSIPALPATWDLTNTIVLVSLADGVSGIIYRTKLTSTTNIELFFEANATGATRFNYIVFKL